MIKIYDYIFPDELIQKGCEYFKTYTEWHQLADAPGYDNATLGRTFNNTFESIAYEFIDFLDHKDFKNVYIIVFHIPIHQDFILTHIQIKD